MASHKLRRDRRTDPSEAGGGVQAAAHKYGWLAGRSHHGPAQSCLASGSDLAPALQCSKLVDEFGLLHLSAGDLLRAHMKSGTPDGNMVAEMIQQGQIVPSRVSPMAPLPSDASWFTPLL